MAGHKTGKLNRQVTYENELQCFHARGEVQEIGRRFLVNKSGGCSSFFALALDIQLASKLHQHAFSLRIS